MKHVVWNEQANESVLGPGASEGVNAVRAFLCRHYAALLAPELLAMKAWKGDASPALAPRGSFDNDLRYWVQHFQESFNRSRGPVAAQLKAKLPNKKLIETGDIDWGTRLVMGINEALATDDAIQLPRGVIATTSALTAIELKAAPRNERFGNAYRVQNLDLLLKKLGLDANQKGMISKKRVAPLAEGNFMVPEGHPLYAKATQESECAALVQCLGVPNTNRWRRGPRVQDIDMLPRGTVIATLNRGIYLSDYSGESHVGIFLSKDRGGLLMLDQHIGDKGNVGIRYKSFGAKHTQSPVSVFKYIDRDFSYRMKTVDQSGQEVYARDYSLATVRFRQNLTQDGSEYYVLVDDGNIARRDAPGNSTAHRRRTAEEQRQARRELGEELFPRALVEEMQKAMDTTELRKAAAEIQAR